MKTYVALLRGINVGGRTIKMAELKQCFEHAGYSNVRTILQTGNVLFDSEVGVKDSSRAIEKALQKIFNYPAKVFVYELSEFATIIEGNPFHDVGETYHNYVVFFDGGLEKQVVSEMSKIDSADDRVSHGKGGAYWLVPKGMTLTSAFAKLLAKAPYKTNCTTRNMRTLRKLVG